MKYLGLLLAVATTSAAVELTIDNYEAETAGKHVFLKMYAPWCGHCKKLKPAWTILANEFRGSPTTLIGDVDCTSSGGEVLCRREHVRGYPTLLWGDPSDLRQYTGGRGLQELAEFARAGLRAKCSAARPDLCDASVAAEVKRYEAVSAEELKAHYIAQLPEMSKGNLVECGGGDGADGWLDLEGCAEAVAAEVKRYEAVPAGDLKLALIESVLTGGADAEAGGGDEL